MERRNRIDRRSSDAGPPRGCCERRGHAERRLPIADELEMSVDDFDKFFGGMLAKSNTGNSAMFDQAAEVFDRVRDRY
jgi:hypothetical protein